MELNYRSMHVRGTKVLLFNEDCMKILMSIPDASIDMILTDPPYGTTKCRWDSIIDLSLMWKEIERIIKPEGAIVLFADQPFTSKLIASNIDLYKYSWVWVKNRCGNYMAAKYKPLKYTEDICVFGFGAVNTKGGKGGGKTTRPHMNYFPVGTTCKQKEIRRGTKLSKYGIHRWNKLSNTTFTSNGSNYPKNYIVFDSVSNKTRMHPTQKPVKLMQYMIDTYCKPGSKVLDFTCGSGPTIKASISAKCDVLGIDNGVCEKEGEYNLVPWIDVITQKIDDKIGARQVRPKLPISWFFRS